MFTAGIFETVVSDEREVVTDEIKMPVPLESADRFEDGPGFADKGFQRLPLGHFGNRLFSSFRRHGEFTYGREWSVMSYKNRNRGVLLLFGA